jgi:hypothetical protein
MIKLTEDKKKELKKQYPKLFMTVLDTDQEFVWRPIKRSEHRKILEDTAELQREECIDARETLICKTCIVFPTEKDGLNDMLEEFGGVCYAISTEVLRKSGFDIKKETREL